MGEIAEMMLDGTFCKECGGIVGNEPEDVGYPRFCELCECPKCGQEDPLDYSDKCSGCDATHEQMVTELHPH